MTSLATRKLHSLVPRMVRAGVMSRKGMVGQVKLLSPMLVKGDLVKMVVGGQRWYSAAAAQEEEEKQNEGELEKNQSRGRKEEIMDRHLYKLDMDVRRTGRALFAELDKTVKMIQLSGECTANQALLVIRCCGEVLVDVSTEGRTKILERYSDIIQRSGVTFDVSHYNALLRVHLENHSAVAASDFLGEMEAAGITPNRVTFQHLVGMYCLEGNIAGATTILEHMKAQDMAINESVFVSLLKGHCANNDADSVSATLDVMASSGLSLGAETFTAMATSYGRSGNWAKVEEIIERAAEEDVKLDDGDIFSIILACSHGGLIKESESLVPKLPRKRGFFQEMRNHIPQLAMSGNVKLAVEIYISLENKEGTDKEGHGMFVVGSVVRSGCSVEEVLEAVKIMENAGYHSSIQYLVQEAAYHWSKEKCDQMVEVFKQENSGVELELSRDLVFRFLRGTFNQNPDVEKMMACLNNLHHMKVEVPNAFISNDLMNQLINIDVGLPGRAAHMLRENCPFLPWNVVTNMVITNLLNRETTEHLFAASGFMLNINIVQTKPDRWNSSLAKAYLVTDNLEDFITIMFLATKKSWQGKEPEKNLQLVFRVLEQLVANAPKYKPGSTVEQVLTPVLEELVSLHIGVPSNVVNALRRQMISEEGKDLLDQAEQEWNKREGFWTEDREAVCLEERRKLYKNSNLAVKRTDTKQNEFRGFIQVPQIREEMENIQNVLASRGEVNLSLSDKLIRAYLEDGMLDQATELLKYSKQKSDFSLSVTNLDILISKIVEQGRWKEALVIVDEQMKSDKVYGSTLSSAFGGMAAAGEHKAVLDRIANVDKSKLVMGSGSKNSFNDLLSAYSSKGDLKLLEEVINALMAGNLVKMDRCLGHFVEVHMVNNDLRAAVVELERIAKQFKKMPKKFDLTNRLIEEENVEDMQSILDTSIELFGEERSLYDLAFSFLSMDKRAQAKKLLETPGLRYDQEKLNYISDQLTESGKLNALDDLVNLSKAIFGCDRDFLYHKLVTAYEADVDKIEDIWLQVQEEGHAPSDSLKIAIAKALKAGGHEVPFEVPVEYAPVVKQQETATKKPNLKTDSTKEKIDLVDEEVYTALTTEDFNAAEEMVMANWATVSLKCKRIVIDTLSKNDRMEEACKVATKLANSFENPKSIRFRESYHKICEKLDEKTKAEFLDGLNPGFRVRLDKSQPDTPKPDSPNRNNLYKVQEEGAGNDEAGAALVRDDITGLVQSFQKANISVNCRNELLEKLVVEDRLDDAASIALAACANYQESKLNDKTAALINKVFEKWEASGQILKTKEFGDKLNPKLGSTVRTNTWVKNGLIRTDPTAYIELIKSEQENSDKWFVHSDVLEEAFQKHPDLLERLEAMDDKSKSSVLLSKWSLLKGDKNSLEKYVQMCPVEILKKKGGVFDKIDTIEKLVLSLDILKRIGADKEILNNAANNCLMRNIENEQFLDIVNWAVESGVQVDNFNTSVLNKLAENSEFKFQSEVNNTLKLRKTKKSL